jgi:hypothetical protein
MELIADGLLIATAMTAGLYCLVLSRRLGRLSESGNGIGSQIDALDQALANTRAALKETRESMSEMRNAAKAAIAKLNHQTEQGEKTAERIERGVGEAKATMQRLYELNDRIEVHEGGSTNASEVGAGVPGGGETADDAESALEFTVESEDVVDASSDWEDDDKLLTTVAAGSEDLAGPKVVLPEGEHEKSEAPPGTSGLKTSKQTGSVLKAERVLL